MKKRLAETKKSNSPIFSTVLRCRGTRFTFSSRVVIGALSAETKTFLNDTHSRITSYYARAFAVKNICTDTSREKEGEGGTDFS